MVYGCLNAYHFHRRQFRDVGVSENSDLKLLSRGNKVRVNVIHTLRAFMFLRSIPTSRVTPSPKRRLEAATLYACQLTTVKKL